MSLEAEQEMWEAIAAQPSPAVRCDRCGRELGTGLPSPCPRCATWEEQARADELADDVMPCGCSSGSCYCDGDATWEVEAV